MPLNALYRGRIRSVTAYAGVSDTPLKGGLTDDGGAVKVDAPTDADSIEVVLLMERTNGSVLRSNRQSISHGLTMLWALRTAPTDGTMNRTQENNHDNEHTHSCSTDSVRRCARSMRSRRGAPRCRGRRRNRVVWCRMLGLWAGRSVQGRLWIMRKEMLVQYSSQVHYRLIRVFS